MTRHWFFILVISIALASLHAHAQYPTEGNLTGALVSMLKQGNTSGYAKMFPDAELIADVVLQNTPPDSRDHQMMLGWKANPSEMKAYDKAIDSVLKANFNSLRQQGVALGVRWKNSQFSRYELTKSLQSRDSIYEKLAPERFVGYVYLYDPYQARTFCFTVGDMMKISGVWYGGTLTRIFEASSRTDYDRQTDESIAAARAGKQYIPFSSRKPDEDDEPDPDAEDKPEPNPKNRNKIIVERKFYTGMFDDEIPVQLYVRGLKGSCPETICSWEAIFKFGDQDDYVYMTVSRTTEGHWVFTEVPPDGVMDLTMKGGTYSGSWTSTNDKAGYEVKLKETPPSEKKLKALENAFDTIK